MFIFVAQSGDGHAHKGMRTRYTRNGEDRESTGISLHSPDLNNHQYYLHVFDANPSSHLYGFR